MCPADGQFPPPSIPACPSLTKRQAAQECRACELWKGTIQAVIGEGRKDSRLMLVGEQPADREDIEGHPFVGPAGRVLDRGLERAGIERKDVCVTNVVKHFRYKARGKRRIHWKPGALHVSACMPWLKAELALTNHASAILRMRDEPARHSAMNEFVADLERVARWLDHG